MGNKLGSKTTGHYHGGELANTKNLRGMFAKAEVKALRENPRLKSPFGFCKAKRTV